MTLSYGGSGYMMGALKMQAANVREVAGHVVMARGGPRFVPSDAR